MAVAQQLRDPLFALMAGLFVNFRGVALDCDASAQLDAPTVGRKTLIARFLYRRILSRRWPPAIRDISGPTKDRVAPIQNEILTGAKEALHTGCGILLLCDDRSTRESAKTALTAPLCVKPGRPS